MLVEGQQAAQQVHVAVGVLHSARQVQDGVVLAVAVFVEPAVGIVEQQAFAVGVPQVLVLLPAHDLVEGGRVLEREAAPGEFLAMFAPGIAGRAQVPLVHQHQVVVAEVLHRHALHALALGQLVEVDDLHRREQVRTGAAGEQPCVQAAFPQLPLVLRRHLFVGGHQHDVVEPPAGPAQVAPVLQDMGVHEEGLAGAGGALEGKGAQVVRCVVREVEGWRVVGLRPVEVGAQRLGVVEIAAQVVLGEQQGQVLVGLPGPAVLPGHAQPPTQRPDVAVVLGEPVGRHPGAGGVQIQRPCVLALTVPVEPGRRVPQPFEHRAQVLVAELAADERVEGEAVLQEGHGPSPFPCCAFRCLFTRYAAKDAQAPNMNIASS